jgi:hypothetical protein
VAAILLNKFEVFGSLSMLPAMIAASTYLPSTSSSTIAASSIHGTGAQNFSSAM